ncbi:hypothetical protein [Neptuniibacter sp. QD37_11]|uniref:hypothetical protein n=1 Tax=Neptuniibacter sp. QD37_11 TaxID=3398209 RepID=UPI0039F4E9AD
MFSGSTETLNKGGHIRQQSWLGQPLRVCPCHKRYAQMRSWMNRKLILLILSFVATNANAEAWSPKVEFNLEGGTYKETLIWVSGTSYAMSKHEELSTLKGANGLFCNAPKIFDSKLILNCLNNKHGGQLITSETAIETIFACLSEKFQCL